MELTTDNWKRLKNTVLTKNKSKNKFQDKKYFQLNENEDKSYENMWM